jgi:hypothetical protein
VKVFLSWSGDLSRRIATALADWLPPVINAVEPFISSEIEKGAQWATELSGELQGSRAGIICLTPDNLDSPWLNYEAGALSKSVTADDEAAPARVWTYLFRLRAADVRYPLAQFQHTEASQDDTLRLMRGINQAVARCGERTLTEPQLTRAFDRWWPVLEEVLGDLPTTNMSKGGVSPPVRSSEEMLAELLELVRGQQSGVDGREREIEQHLTQLLGAPSSKVYVGGTSDAVTSFIQELLSLSGVTSALIGGDTTGVFVLVTPRPTYAQREYFERVMRQRAAKSNVAIKSIRW